MAVEIHITSDVIRTPCEYLTLRVREGDIPHYKAYLSEINNTYEDNTPEEIAEYKEELLRLNKSVFNQASFQPYCSKLNQVCIVTESVAIGEGFMPIRFILVNSKRIPECGDEKITEPEFLDDFVLKRLDLEYLSHQALSAP